ncbi:MAG: ATP-binding protein [Rickettsiales bacterium]|jgi:SpoVK/Ycf46/Vps4 family AAA+-type ATPase|nr:ATP-binding protein [Rickettsiales bacterium]
MYVLDPYFPKNYEIIKGIKIIDILVTDKNYQIYKIDNEEYLLAIHKILKEEQIINFGGEIYTIFIEKSIDELKNIANIKKEKFSLPGCSYLEDFFYENVIDIVFNLDRYKRFSINFPSPIILYGKPGTGKTFAVDRLAKFLGWKVFNIDSNTIGSSYIHQTSIKISEIFNEAFENSPAIIIIDEMESYLSNRDSAHQHAVEEIGEFLRLIPKAIENNVLLIGITNMIDKIDPAIMRTGRFSNKIEVRPPNEDDIRELLISLLKNMPTEDIDLDFIVSCLIGKTRSDVDFLIKESARLTAFKKKDKITQDIFNEILKKHT